MRQGRSCYLQTARQIAPLLPYAFSDNVARGDIVLSPPTSQAQPLLIMGQCWLEGGQLPDSQWSLSMSRLIAFLTMATLPADSFRRKASLSMLDNHRRSRVFS